MCVCVYGSVYNDCAACVYVNVRIGIHVLITLVSEHLIFQIINIYCRRMCFVKDHGAVLQVGTVSCCIFCAWSQGSTAAAVAVSAVVVFSAVVHASRT